MKRSSRLMTALALTATSAAVGAATASGASEAQRAFIPKTLKIVVSNGLPRNPGDGGYGVQGYPRVALRSGKFYCWYPEDIVSLTSPVGTAPQALAGGAPATFRTSVDAGYPVIPSPCKPAVALLFPHYLEYAIVIQEHKGAPWQVAKSGPRAMWELLTWTTSYTPNPADGFATSIPPTGTMRSTEARAICVSGTGYPFWPLPSLFRNDTLTLTVTPQCPTPAGGATPDPGGPAATPEASTIRVLMRPGARTLVALGSSGETWELRSCAGARATPPRSVRRDGVIGSVVSRRSPGQGTCTFVTNSESPNAVVTVEVTTRR